MFLHFSDCPTQYARHGTYCYYMSENDAKLNDAKALCEGHAKKWGGVGHLVHPSTPEKYYFVRHAILR